MSNIKCPNCGKSHYIEGFHSVTAMYFPPIYKNGVNINPDRNWHTIECECLECHHKFRVSSNGDDYKVEDLGEIKIPNVCEEGISGISGTKKYLSWNHTFITPNEEKQHATIDLGGLKIKVTNHFTPKQIKNIKKYFGWTVTNEEK